MALARKHHCSDSDAGKKRQETESRLVGLDIRLEIDGIF